MLETFAKLFPGQGRSVGSWQPLRLLLAAALVAGLAACSSDDELIPTDPNEASVEELYDRAVFTMEAGEYATAAVLFDDVERLYPYSIWAPRAQLMAAYAYYLDNRYDEAINSLDRFIELHPGSKDAPYAHYLKALSYYEQISDVERDQQMTRQALSALNDVIRRYPDSRYARDARLKRDLAVDHLAGQEMLVGRFYQDKGDYLAAINRYRAVITQFQTTTQVPEALHRLVEAYMALGIMREAQATAAVLGYNYPGSQWYTDSYYLLTGVDLRPEEQPDSWIAGVWPF
ncbi:MAG: outer membrane protein assembly factor BamD [Rhodospirillales bacterium]